MKLAVGKVSATDVGTAGQSGAPADRTKNDSSGEQK